MKNCIVIGLGEFGYSVAKHLSLYGSEVLVIDKDKDLIQNISNEKIVSYAVIADSTDQNILKKLGIGASYDIAVVCIGNDIEASIITTLNLKELNVKEVYVKGNSPLHEKLLKKIGADLVIFPEQEMGKKIASDIMLPKKFEDLNLSDSYKFTNIEVPKKFIGKTLIELNLRNSFDANLIAIQRKEDNKEKILLSLNANTIIKDKDILLLVIHVDNISKLIKSDEEEN
jgi:trk system potassium uptake protein TrkA